MRRTKPARIADAILTSDLHVRDTVPVARIDDYFTAQERKLSFLRQLSDENRLCPILCAGDIFHKWRSSPWLMYLAYRLLPYPMYTIPGNHELPMHSMENYEKSALHLLEAVCKKEGLLTVLKCDEPALTDKLLIYGIPFGQMENAGKFDVSTRPRTSRRTVLLLHELTWERKPAWAHDDYSADELIDKFGEYFDLIVTGDNHQSFVTKKHNTLLVNPGSMMRMTADQMDHEPCCYLYYADENEVRRVPFPIEDAVLDRDHIDRKEEHDKRIAAYIERINTQWKRGLSFRDNLAAFFKANRTPKKVRDLIWQQLDTETTT